MDQVDLHQLSRDVATDPISLIDDLLYSAETQTQSPRRKPQNTIETQTDDLPYQPHHSPIKPHRFDPGDWSKSKIYALVKSILELPAENKLVAAKALEKEFLDHKSLGIFTEEEASYNSSLLRKRLENDEAQMDEFFLKEMFHKSKKTVEVLAGCLQLNRSKFEQEDIFAQLQMEKSKKAEGGHVDVPSTSIVLLHSAYKEININTVIILLLRCKRLY